MSMENINKISIPSDVVLNNISVLDSVIINNVKSEGIVLAIVIDSSAIWYKVRYTANHEEKSGMYLRHEIRPNPKKSDKNWEKVIENENT